MQANPLGVHFMVFGPEWSGDAREPIAGAARECGFDYLEVTALDPVTFDAKGTRRALDNTNMTANLCTAMSFESDISSAEPADVARGEDHLNRCLDIASEVGAQWLVGVTYGAWGRYSQGPTRAGYENCSAVLRKVCARGADMGISIGMEVLNRFENNFLNTTSQARSLIADVGVDNLYVQLDSYHAHLEESGQTEAVIGCGGKLGYLHVGESHRGRLGTGSVDFDALFRGVAGVDFAGPITFEAFSAHLVGPEGAKALCVWRDQWSDSAEFASHARQFITNKLTTARSAISSQFDDNRR